MEKGRSFLRQLKSFNSDSDYFCLVDALHVLFEPVLPTTNRRLIQVPWAILKLFYTLQYLGLVFQLIRTSLQRPLDIDAFMAVFNMGFIWTVALSRGFCIALHRRTLLQLKSFINSKVCLREDTTAFDLRRATFWKNVKYVTIFQLYTVINVGIWCFTEFLSNEVFRIPIPLEHLPRGLRTSVELFYACVCNSWSILCWISFTQFGTILNSLRTELRIVTLQFKGLLESVAAGYVLEVAELAGMRKNTKDCFWSELDSKFKRAISQHSLTMSYCQQLKEISSWNFLILLSSAAVLITMNMFLFILEPSVRRVPLLVVSCQFMFEVYVCCALFDGLQRENNRIARFVYAVDWLSATGRDGQLQRKCHKSIQQNAQVLLLQVHGQGLTVRAGGMIGLNLETFANLINLVYSMLTFLMKMRE